MADKHNFTTKIYKCCSGDKDEIRAWVRAVHFKNNYAYASDGHILVRTSLDYQRVINPEILEGKSIHMDNFKEVIKFEIAECCPDGIACKNTDGQSAFYEYFEMGDVKVPDFDSVFPPESKTESIDFIGINPKLVERITSAMYSDDGVFRFKFTGKATAIVVTSTGYTDQVGIIMPSFLSESIFE